MFPATSSTSKNNEHVAHMEFFRKTVCIIFFQGNLFDSSESVMILIGLLCSGVLETLIYFCEAVFSPVCANSLPTKGF